MHTAFNPHAVPAVVELADLIGMPPVQEHSWAADFPTTHACYAGMTRPQWFSRLSGKPDVLLNMGGQAQPGHYPRDQIPD